MKHRASRAMFEYWNERRGARPAPARADIEPGRIRTILADAIILAVDAQADHPFRLAGTRVCALFGREMKNEPFVRLWAETSQPVIRELVAIATHEAVGVVSSACAKMADNPPLDLELLMLPLYHRGRLDDRLLGVLAPIIVPCGLGICPIEPMELRVFRYIAPATEIMARPLRALAPGLPPQDGLAAPERSLGNGRTLHIVSQN